jgi:hypothetical protein
VSQLLHVREILGSNLVQYTGYSEPFHGILPSPRVNCKINALNLSLLLLSASYPVHVSLVILLEVTRFAKDIESNKKNNRKYGAVQVAENMMSFINLLGYVVYNCLL